MNENGPDGPPEAGPSHGADWDEDEYEPYEGTFGSARGGTTRIIALVVLIAVAFSYVGVNVYSALTRDDAVAVTEALADPDGFKFLGLDPASGQPIRYDPCTPLPWVFNPANAPVGGFDDILEAMARTSAATGIEFVYEGETDERVTIDRELVQPERYGGRWAPLLVGWIAHDSDIFEIDNVGVAGSAIEENDQGRLVYVTGGIILNGAEQLANGFAPGKTWGKVVMHELGHVLGLDHVPDPSQIMNDTLVSSPADWGAGDLAGLRRLGEQAGCIKVPDPS